MALCIIAQSFMLPDDIMELRHVKLEWHVEYSNRSFRL